MAELTEDILLTEPVKKKRLIPTIAPKIIVEKAKDSINFLILWTAVGWYYFFSGLYMLKYGKLPKGWKPITEKEVIKVISNVAEFTAQRKSEKRYGKVVDLDKDFRAINLMR